MPKKFTLVLYWPNECDTTLFPMTTSSTGRADIIEAVEKRAAAISKKHKDTCYLVAVITGHVRDFVTSGYMTEFCDGEKRQ